MADTPQTQPFNGLPPTIFDGDRSYSQAFLTQFRIFARINRRHTDVTYPHRRVKLALSFIHGPLVNDWKWTVYHGLAAIPTGEAWWDEFIRAFTATWIDDPIAPDESLFAPRASVPMPSIRAVLGSLTPTAASTTTLADDEEDWALFAPRVASDPPPLVTPAAPRIEKRKQHDTSDEEETHPSKHPRIAPRTGPPRARPQLGRRSVPLPRKIAYKPRRAPSAPVLSITPFLVPYSPPPRQPPGPPGDPVHAPPLVDPDPKLLAPGRTIVEDDKTLTGGVKTLDDSVFAPVSTQDDAASTPLTGDASPQTPLLTPDAADSPPQTPPSHAYVFPRHALERPRDPDKLATRATNRQNRGNTRPYPPTSSHHDPNDVRKARVRHALTDEERRRYLTEGRHPKTLTTKPVPAPDDNHADASPATVVARPKRRRRRATAAAPSTPPSAVTRDRDRHAPAESTRDQPKPPTRNGDTARRHADRPAQVVRQPDNHNPRRTETAETTPETDRANAAVRSFLRQFDAAQATPKPTPTPANRAYDAVTRHLDFCLTTHPDMTGITQPFALQPGPRAVLHKWKKK
ncbi:hypothetical protein EDB89DRAFT_1908285 [Lactarius sanguifluus]|nr:hypothetical protein EDB89DRAFT_1908285 [Lactarius sanguifluus]